MAIRDDETSSDDFARYDEPVTSSSEDSSIFDDNVNSYDS
jgi:hypothetical protein